MKKLYLLVLSVMISVSTVWAQQSEILSLAKGHLSSQANKLGFQSSDLNDLTVQTHYLNSKTNVEYAYIQQNLGGYPVYNAIASFALKNGQVVSMKQTFQTNLSQRIGSQNAISDINQIASSVAQNLGFILNDSAFLNTDFTNQLMYYPTENGTLNLCWIIHLNVKQDGQIKILEAVAHAQTGDIYLQNNHMLSCNFHSNTFDNLVTDTNKSENIKWLQEQYNFNTTLDGAQYRVYDLPIEAATFGDRSLVENPMDEVASPYGWHDTNGVNGAEYTHTQGNNVIAVNDQDSEGINWIVNGGSYTFNGFAEGGSDLIFDFPIDFSQNLYKSADASTTNLFYINNKMHDIWYQYGFTEPAGNFQFNNYGNGGLASDEVQAFGQTGESLGALNNAAFAAPPDGNNPSMLMFMWTSNEGDDHLFSINTPGEYQGDYSGVLAKFGGTLPDPPITQNLAVAIDDNSAGGTDPNDGCGNITNGAQLNGKIVLVKRGNCSFVEKVKNVQNEGALAVVVVNNTAGALIAMTGNDSSITIPSIMIGINDGNSIIDAVLDNTTLEGTLPKDGHWDGYKDGTLDNGIMAHEYGHGISNRLTGGPASASCLQNDEQMGEGWSDFFALVMTIEPGDQGTDGRGMGTYAISQPTTGAGIRPSRYSTDMSINPSTYNRIKTVSIPHGVGYVWATMLWDMTWELIDEYGFDPDLHNGTGGNNLAMQLVIDGLKLQSCSPGFIDGRDAILEADEINNEGVNQCRIWRAFAKRGLGYGATQGNSSSVNDGTESYVMPPQDILDCSHLATNEISNFQLSIYPNPTKGEFYILTEKTYRDSAVSIKDLTGKIVYNSTINLSNSRGTINIQNLPTGIYIVSIDTEDGTITKKLIKK